MKRKHIVALILEENGKILVEKRKKSKFSNPGFVVFPSGKVEKGETKEQALIREMKEELGIEIFGLNLVYSADSDCEELQKIFWYECDGYNGTIVNNEAEKLLWINPSEKDLFSLEISREALAKFLEIKNNK